jgi:hypothetical protein
MTSSVTALNTRDLKPRIGIDMLADKAALLSGEHAETLGDLLERRGVLMFPQMGFTGDQQITFTEAAGGGLLTNWPNRGRRRPGRVDRRRPNRDSGSARRRGQRSAK